MFRGYTCLSVCTASHPLPELAEFWASEALILLLLFPRLSTWAICTRWAPVVGQTPAVSLPCL